MSPILLAGSVALTTFVVIVLATVLADLAYVRNRVPLTVIVAPALLAVAFDLHPVALGWLALMAVVTAQRDAETDRFGLVTTLLMFVTFGVAWMFPRAAMVSPVSLLAVGSAVAVAFLLLRRIAIEPVPWKDQASVLLLVLLVAATDAVR